MSSKYLLKTKHVLLGVKYPAVLFVLILNIHLFNFNIAQDKQHF